ncbi:hypothetical protein D9M72_552030 [compost metagenome]
MFRFPEAVAFAVRPVSGGLAALEIEAPGRSGLDRRQSVAVKVACFGAGATRLDGLVCQPFDAQDQVDAHLAFVSRRGVSEGCLEEDPGTVVVPAQHQGIGGRKRRLVPFHDIGDAQSGCRGCKGGLVTAAE